MTPNQLILLLEIYRGTEPDHRRVGTYARDLVFLVQQDLAHLVNDHLYTTTKADAQIRNALFNWELS